jgi:RNA polymerase sigma-70 factor (ECF subfamily)
MEELNKIWREVKAGSEKAFYVFYTMLFPNLVKYVRQMVKDIFLAEDIVQDMFIKIWHERDSIHIFGSVHTYIYKMAHHATVNQLQHLATSKNRVNRTVSDGEWQFIIDNYQVNDSIIEQMEMEETETAIRLVVETLPAKCKEVFIMSRYDEMTNDEIAQKTGISVHTVRTHLYHALDVIRQKIMITSK